MTALEAPIVSNNHYSSCCSTTLLPPLDFATKFSHLEPQQTARTSTPSGQNESEDERSTAADTFLTVPVRSFFANGVDIWILIMQYLPEKVAVRIVGAVNCASFRASLDETVRLSFFSNPVTFNDASNDDLRHAHSAVLLAGADNDCPSLLPKIEGETYLDKDRFAQFLGLNNHRQVLSYEDRHSLVSGALRAPGDVSLATLPQVFKTPSTDLRSPPSQKRQLLCREIGEEEKTSSNQMEEMILEDASLVTRHVPSAALPVEDQKPLTLTRGKKYNGPLKAAVSSIECKSKCGQFAILKATTGESFVLNTVTGKVQCTFNEQFSFDCFEWVPEEFLRQQDYPTTTSTSITTIRNQLHQEDPAHSSLPSSSSSSCSVGLITVSTAEGKEDGAPSVTDTILIQLWKIPVNPTAGCPAEVWSRRVMAPRVFLKHRAGSAVRVIVPPPPPPSFPPSKGSWDASPASSSSMTIWVLEGATRWMFLSLQNGEIVQDLDAPYSYEEKTILGAEFLDYNGRFAAMWGSRKFILYDLTRKNCLEFTPDCPKSSYGWSTARLSAVSYSRTAQTLLAVSIESQEGSILVSTFSLSLPRPCRHADTKEEGGLTSRSSSSVDDVGEDHRRPNMSSTSNTTVPDDDVNDQQKMTITQLPFYKVPKKLLGHEEDKHMSWTGKAAKILPLSFGFAFFFPPPQENGIQQWPGEDPTCSSSLYVVPVNLATSEIITAASCNTSNWIEEQLPLRTRGADKAKKKPLPTSSLPTLGKNKMDPLSKDDPKIAVISLPPNAELNMSGTNSNSSRSYILDVIASPGGHTLRVLTEGHGSPSDLYLKRYHCDGRSFLAPKTAVSRRIITVKLFSDKLTTGGKRLLPPLSLKRTGLKKLSFSSCSVGGDGTSSSSGCGLSSARTASTSNGGTSLKSLKSTRSTSKSSLTMTTTTTTTPSTSTISKGLRPTIPPSRTASKPRLRNK